MSLSPKKRLWINPIQIRLLFRCCTRVRTVTRQGLVYHCFAEELREEVWQKTAIMDECRSLSAHSRGFPWVRLQCCTIQCPTVCARTLCSTTTTTWRGLTYHWAQDCPPLIKQCTFIADVFRWNPFQSCLGSIGGRSERKVWRVRTSRSSNYPWLIDFECLAFNEISESRHLQVTFDGARKYLMLFIWSTPEGRASWNSMSMEKCGGLWYSSRVWRC